MDCSVRMRGSKAPKAAAWSPQPWIRSPVQVPNQVTNDGRVDGRVECFAFSPRTTGAAAQAASGSSQASQPRMFGYTWKSCAISQSQRCAWQTPREARSIGPEEEAVQVCSIFTLSRRKFLCHHLLDYSNLKKKGNLHDFVNEHSGASQNGHVKQTREWGSASFCRSKSLGVSLLCPPFCVLAQAFGAEWTILFLITKKTYRHTTRTFSVNIFCLQNWKFLSIILSPYPTHFF